MKKKFWHKVSYIFIILLMIFFAIRNLDKLNGQEVEAAVPGDSVDIKLFNGNENAGDLVFTIGDDTTKEYKEATVPYGTIINVTYKLNDGYTLRYWANHNYQTYNIVDKDEETPYTESTLSFKAEFSYNVFAVATNSSEHLITFNDTSSTELASIIGFAVVEDGGKANLDNVFIPDRRGFDFEKFSSSLDNITEDMTVYPMYDSNVYTILRDYWQLFLKGLGVTLLLAVISTFLALFLGLVLCLGKLSRFKPFNVIASTYIEVVRGIPSLLMLLIVYVIVGPTKIHIGSFFSTELLSCILALFINSGAYTAEIFRSGVQAVDAGQTEAGRALGLSHWQVLKQIVLPQGIKNSLPSLGNELVMIIKETSLAYSVNSAIGELMSAKVTITSATGDTLSPYIIIAVIYFIVTFSLSRIIKYLEKRLNQ